MFKGTMLRGSLLNAYAFWKMGSSHSGAHWWPSPERRCC